MDRLTLGRTVQWTNMGRNEKTGLMELRPHEGKIVTLLPSVARVMEADGTLLWVDRSDLKEVK